LVEPKQIIKNLMFKKLLFTKTYYSTLNCCAFRGASDN
jgi:hypothetical protein